MSAAPVEELVDERGLRWRIDPAYAESVRRVLVPRLDGLSGEPGVHVVKRNRVRTVMRLALDVGGRSVGVFLKRYHPRGFWAAFRQGIRGSNARREFEMAAALEDAGVPTAHPIAWAEKRRFGLIVDAVYACVEIVDATPFGPYVETRAPEPETDTADALRRRRMLGDLVHIVRKMHDRGLDQADLHGGNVLVAPDETHREVRIHLIDLHRSWRRGSPLSPHTRVRRLVQLLHSIREVADRSARYRFVRDYVAGLDGMGELKALVSRIERGIGRWERRRILSRSKRPLIRSSRFDFGRERGFAVWFRRSHPPSRLVDVVREHDAIAAGGDGPAILKRGARATVTRGRLRGPGGEEEVVVKEYHVRFRHALAALFGRSRGRRAWLNGNALRVRGVRTATPYGWLAVRRGPFLRRELIVMEDVAVHGERLDRAVLRRHRSGDLSRDTKRKLLELGAAFLARLHGAGVGPGDFKACNLYVGEDEGRLELRLVDHDDIRFRWSVSMRRRVENLAQLSASIPRCVTRTDRLRFFRLYAPSDADRWRVFARAVDRECAGKIIVDMEPIE